jgi:hypothetical protein
MRNHKERVSSTDSDIPRDTPYRRRPSWHPQTLNNQHLTLDLVPLCCGKGVETRWDGAGEACILTRGRETTVVKNLPAYAGAPSQVLHVSDARAAARWCLDFSREFHPVLCLETWVCPACNEPADVARMWHNRPICLPLPATQATKAYQAHQPYRIFNFPPLAPAARQTQGQTGCALSGSSPVTVKSRYLR